MVSAMLMENFQVLILKSSRSTIGPPVGGALAVSGAWRWLFYLNLPLCGLALTLTLLLLRVHTPKASLREKIVQMDWM